MPLARRATSRFFTELRGRADTDSDAPTRSSVWHRGRRGFDALGHQRESGVARPRTRSGPVNERFVRVQAGGPNAVNPSLHDRPRPGGALHARGGRALVLLHIFGRPDAPAAGVLGRFCALSQRHDAGRARFGGLDDPAVLAKSPSCLSCLWPKAQNLGGPGAPPALGWLRRFGSRQQAKMCGTARAEPHGKSQNLHAHLYPLRRFASHDKRNERGRGSDKKRVYASRTLTRIPLTSRGQSAMIESPCTGSLRWGLRRRFGAGGLPAKGRRIRG
jgi:hypothetical protein